jgi:hypothetical protein
MADSGTSAALTVANQGGATAARSAAYSATPSLLGVALELGVTGLGGLAVDAARTLGVRPGQTWTGQSAAIIV